MHYNLTLIPAAKTKSRALATCGMALAISQTLSPNLLAAEPANIPLSAPPVELKAKAEKAPPLPLHQVEGNGGLFATTVAYLVNPPPKDNWAGLPSVGFAFVDLGHNRNLLAFTATETLWGRLEIGYAFNRFTLGDLPFEVEKATTMKMGSDYVGMHNLNARVQLIPENSFEKKRMPAVTLGLHSKFNTDIDSIDKNLVGTLMTAGVEDSTGFETTLVTTKMLTFLPRPVIASAGFRCTDAAHLGLLGFTRDYTVNFEGSVAVLVTDWLALVAEYKQKPQNYKPVGALIMPEDDWWTIDAAFILSRHTTVAVGYGHFGRVLNHTANGSWGLTVKYEF